MRISLSMLLAMMVSFSLLTVMARLVATGDIPPHVSVPETWLPDLTPPGPTPKPPTVRTAPDKPTVKSPPAGPKPLLPANELPHVGTEFPKFDPNGKSTGTWQPTEMIGPGSPELTTERNTKQTGGYGLVALSQIQPMYPRAEAAKGIEGWVSLRFQVMPDGRVVNVQVTDALPRNAFETAAKLAVSKWRYRAHDNGVVNQTVTLDFHLDN